MRGKTFKNVLPGILSLAVILSAIAVTVTWGREDAPITAVTNRPPVVYLTFDDGPSVNTEKVLDILAAENVQATFFVIGVTTDFGIELYNRIIAEGHMLGLHTYSHNTQKIYNSIDGYVKDFMQLEDWILETTGTKTQICRMVGGSHTVNCSKALREQILTYLFDRGYTCYDWDIDPKDSGAYALDTYRLAQNVINAVEKKKGQDLIILLHDDGLRTTLPDALKQIIAYFRGQGYEFGVLSEGTESVKRVLPSDFAAG